MRLAEILQGLAAKQEELMKIEDEILDYQQRNSGVKESFPSDSEKLMVFLENPEIMRAKILNFITESDVRLEKMEADFKESREKLLRDLEELQNQQSHQSSSSSEEMLKNSKKLEEMRTEIERNNCLAEKLRSRLEQISKKDLDRGLMIRRIMEMTGSIQKQDQEIQKVIMENLSVQRELKWLTQTLHRTFNTIEETLFR
ncbi:hypothetical protein NECAME_04877, partial [Necator americanus]